MIRLKKEVLAPPFLMVEIERYCCIDVIAIFVDDVRTKMPELLADKRQAQSGETRVHVWPIPSR